MNTQKKILLIILGLFGLGLALQIYRVDIRKTVWPGPDHVPSVYAVLDYQGRILTYTFLEDQTVIATAEGRCLRLGEYNAVAGNKFFGRLWKTKVPGWHWARKFTIVEPGLTPVALTISFKKGAGEICGGFPRPGRTVSKYAEINDFEMRLDGKHFIRLKDETISAMHLDETLSYLEDL